MTPRLRKVPWPVAKPGLLHHHHRLLRILVQSTPQLSSLWHWTPSNRLVASPETSHTWVPPFLDTKLDSQAEKLMKKSTSRLPCLLPGTQMTVFSMLAASKSASQPAWQLQLPALSFLSQFSHHIAFQKHTSMPLSGTRSLPPHGTPTQNMLKITTLSGVTKELLEKSIMH